MPLSRPTRVALVALVALVLAPAALAAQGPGADVDRPIPAPNAAYFELGGNAILYSLNYDRRLRDRLSARIGIMYIGGSATTSEGDSGEVDLLLIPILVNGLFGGGSSLLELGIGPLFGGGSGSGTTVEGVDFEFSGFTLAGVASTLGYRYQPRDGGFVFRAGLTPFWLDDIELWGGLSFGYAF